MWLLVTEALAALGLLLFIVWWTLGPTQRREREALQREIEAETSAVKPTNDRVATRLEDPDSKSR